MKICRRFLELFFILIFIYYILSVATNNPSTLRISAVTFLILASFALGVTCLNKKDLPSLFNLTLLFYIGFSVVQTLRNINLIKMFPMIYMSGISPFYYEILHYILMFFILSYYLKHKDIINIGIVLFIVYSFRVFDMNLADNEFVFIHGLTIVLYILWFEQIMKEKTRILLKNPTLLPIALFLSMGIISTIKGQSLYGSLQQLLIIANFISIAFFISNRPRDKAQRELILNTMLFISGLLMILAISLFFERWGYYGNIVHTLRRRIRIGVIHPNAVAGYFTFMLLMLMSTSSFYKSDVFRRWVKFVVFCMLIILLLTYSRMGWFSFIFGVMILAMIKPKAGFSRRLGGPFLILALIFIIFTSLTPTRNKIFERFLDSESNRGNFYSCSVTLNSIKHNAILGVGINNYYSLAKYFTVPIALDAKEKNTRVTRELLRCAPHGLFLGITWGMGIFGLAAFVWILLSFFKFALNLLKTIDYGYDWALVRGILASIAAMAVHGIIATVFHITILPAFFWIFIGIVIAIGNSRINLEQKADYRPMRYYFIFFVIVIIAMLTVVNPIIAEKYYGDGVRSVGRNHLDKALSEFEVAIRLVPINPRYYEALGDVYIYKNSIDSAIKTYQKAINFKKNFAIYHTKLGWLYWYKKMYSQALAEFKNAVISDRYGALGGEHFSDLGLAYAIIGNYKEAVIQFNEAAKVEPEILNSKFWRDCNIGNKSIPLEFNRLCLENWATTKLNTALYRQK